MMKILTLLHIAAVILISSFSKLYAQKLIGLDYNQAIKNQLLNKTAFKSTQYTPPTPSGYLFFDDFSTYRKSVFPDPNRWTDKYAFINQTYPDSCISIGVATLDAIDASGNIYATDDNITPSDTLTSKVISLEGESGNLYFSFFVQGGGKGGVPEESDSLLVEFYNSTSSKWIEVWVTEGYESHTFKQVILPIDSEYRTSGFRFRFRNYTSLRLKDAKGGVEGALSNSDIWNIDYVVVREAADTNEMKALNDVAFVEPLLSTHTNYTSIPYSHMEVATQFRRSSIPVSFRTYYPDRTDYLKITRNYQTFNIYKGLKEIQNEESSVQNNELPFEYISWDDFFTSNYNYYADQNYGHYQEKSFIKVDGENQYLYNDTIVLEETFKDYYAYDDGTAEYGIGLPGNGGVGIRLAYMFNLCLLKGSQDTLTAVDIQFTHSRNNAQKDAEFNVCIWDADGNNPGDLIYPQGNVEDWTMYSPDTTLAINEFMRINLDEDLLVSDTIFVGLAQWSTDNYLSIGYDINTNTRSRIRTNDGNGWLTPISTIPKGSLMIRPVFGHKVYASAHETASSASGTLKIYPNPAREYINIIPVDNIENYQEYEVSVINMLGQQVIKTGELKEQLNISNLEPGVYIVRITHIPSKSTYIQKFLKTE